VVELQVLAVIEVEQAEVEVTVKTGLCTAQVVEVVELVRTETVVMQATDTMEL
jgi:hypothetical protein